MAYIDFKALVKKVNLKPKGVKEIVLEVNGSGLDGKLDKLSEMIDQNVEIQLESLTVMFNVAIDINTNEPIKRYTVDQKGVVSELKEAGKQMEADLGLPIEKRTKEEEKQMDRDQVDQFILEGLAPNYDDLPKDFSSYVKRRLEGESYSKMATELEISSGKIVDMMDDYRKRIAPLAQAWWDWKQGEPGAEKDEEAKPNETRQDNEKTDTEKAESDQKTGDSGQSEDEKQDGAA
ncbi:2-methylcitrate dehydratase [Bacillus badius]|uniref:2-methylcitrate dehydratase n=1 Tax=Bacillus badius TaxID=1455 RepID=UPI001CBB1567|nr:2-methylcitrate dehydratase [Bacillus badius]UAT29959.1 2-methylcitrate dehydratase [Bacillus badius]